MYNVLYNTPQHPSFKSNLSFTTLECSWMTLSFRQHSPGRLDIYAATRTGSNVHISPDNKWRVPNSLVVGMPWASMVMSPSEQDRRLCTVLVSPAGTVYKRGAGWREVIVLSNGTHHFEFRRPAVDSSRAFLSDGRVHSSCVDDLAKRARQSAHNAVNDAEIDALLRAS